MRTAFRIDTIAGPTIRADTNLQHRFIAHSDAGHRPRPVTSVGNSSTKAVSELSRVIRTRRPTLAHAEFAQ